MATKKKPNKPVMLGDIAYDDMTPSQQLATDIQGAFPDLEPSVRRILEAELDEDQRLNAMTLFHISLSSPGDPNRDPRHAIAVCGPATV
jgi:hypothetical protein